MKHNITFKLKDESRTIKVTTDAVRLSELVTAFEDFLRGCGFQIKSGTLEINSEDEDSFTSEVAFSSYTDEDTDKFLQENQELIDDLEDDSNTSGAV